MNRKTQPGLSLMKMNNSKQSGFTLVEIAIVLVVIGLLLGGILKGQQLINSARVRNLADQNSGVQAAYYGFIDRFRSLPGDMPPQAACTNLGVAVDSGVATPCGTPADAPGGNGNGRIDSIREAGAVWAHLSAAGFLSGTYSGFSGNTAPTAVQYSTGVITGDIPPNAFQGAILLGHTNSYKDTDATLASVTRLVYSFGGNIPVPLLRDLDQKLDDGVAATGVLRSSSSATDAGTDVYAAIVQYDDSVAECLAGINWDVDSPNPECNAVFLY